MSERAQISPRQWAEALRWLVFVDEDIGAIGALVASSPPAVRSAAFHCQQAVEKMAKAVIVAFGAAAPKIHDVEELSFLVEDFDPGLGQAIRNLANLTSWYIAVRYPDIEVESLPSLRDVATILTGLRNLRRQVDTLAPKS